MFKEKGLEKLVPPLELCKQIPEGAFCDSALVHAVVFCKSCSLSANNVVVPSSVVEDNDGYRYICPAPTLQEILAVLPCDMLADFYLSPTDRGTYRIDMVTNDTASEIANGDTPATAALKLWMEMTKK